MAHDATAAPDRTAAESRLVAAPVTDRRAGARFALHLPHLRYPISQIEELVRSAEALGFDAVWFTDHVAAAAAPDHDNLDGWTVAAALARRTERIRLGHVVLGAGLRHPALLAKMAATLDTISDGRLDLGLGWASLETEFERYGHSADSPRQRAEQLAETIEIIQRMFTGEPFSFAGRHHEIDDLIGRPTPVNGHIPLHLGGGRRRHSMPLVRRYADWWTCPGHAIDHLADLAPMAGSARIEVQHPVGLAASRNRRDDVAADARRHFGGTAGLVVGTPAEVAEQFRAEARDGVESFVVQFDDRCAADMIRLFAREVIPAVRTRSGLAASA